MFEPVKIAPSILSADFMHMADEIAAIEEAGAGYVHVDVMDGHFVPNLTIGVPIVAQLTRIARIPLDVHLMISNPLTELPWFLEAEPEIVTVHLEALQNEEEAFRAIELMHQAGVKAAFSIKPDTAVASLAPYISQLDMVLVMSVYPGFSGQSYIEGSDTRVAEVVRMAEAAGVSPLIEVDGGMGVKTAGGVCAAGADVLVAGNAVYKAESYAQAIASITAVAEEARRAALLERERAAQDSACAAQDSGRAAQDSACAAQDPTSAEHNPARAAQRPDSDAKATESAPQDSTHA